jgi:hypothetical protein
MLRNDVYLCIINTFGANVKSAAADLTPHCEGKKNQPIFSCHTARGKKSGRSFDLSCVTWINVCCFFILLTFFFTSISSASCQNNNFLANTIDELHWKETGYMCSDSPLSPLTGYKDIYKEKGICEIDYSWPIHQDKNYLTCWTIIDSMLYLYDVKNVCTFDSIEYHNPERKNIEKFLHAKFSRNPLPENARRDERYKSGVIPAAWFTGVLYIKRYPEEGELFKDYEKYKNAKFTRLTFNKGRLTEETVVSYMQ